MGGTGALMLVMSSESERTRKHTRTRVHTRACANAHTHTGHHLEAYGDAPPRARGARRASKRRRARLREGCPGGGVGRAGSPGGPGGKGGMVVQKADESQPGEESGCLRRDWVPFNPQIPVHKDVPLNKISVSSQGVELQPQKR